MEEIRKSKEEEVVLLDVKFRLPGVVYGFFGGLAGLTLIIAVFTQNYSLVFSSFVIFGIMGILHIQVAFNKLIITNKTISGSQFFLIGHKDFCYRFDMLDNVESVSILGFNNMKLSFTQGYTTFQHKNKANSERHSFMFIANFGEVTRQLSELIKSTRNDRDVQTEIALMQYPNYKNKEHANNKDDNDKKDEPKPSKK